VDFDSYNDHPDFGSEISRITMKDGNDVIIYKRGNMLLFVKNGKIEKQFHTDDIEVLVGAFMDLV